MFSMVAMCIAIVGSGVAGLNAAGLLNHRHQTALYERNARSGGHSNTRLVQTGADANKFPLCFSASSA
jgi:predicted NAD/FAD-binding protein